MDYRQIVIKYLNQSLKRPYNLFNKEDAIILKFVVDLKGNETLNADVILRSFINSTPKEVYKYLDKAYDILIKYYNIKVYLNNNNYIIEYK